MEDETDRGDRIAGAVVLRTQIVAVVALLAAVVFALATIEKPEFGTISGLMMIASAIAFGLLANAVLRR